MVVVKPLLPERARERRWLSSIIEEVRFCLTLQHPKIVRFIGVTWITVVDIGLAMEYLPHGDLSSLLERQRKRERLGARARDGYTWFATDGPSSVNPLVYLHSFERPIIYRDLKPKNVLLSASWEAKVTDFGTSRALEEDDQTLTAEIGTVAWIAPEIRESRCLFVWRALNRVRYVLSTVCTRDTSRRELSRQDIFQYAHCRLGQCWIVATARAWRLSTAYEPLGGQVLSV
ncbi:hypothetical protein PsorP6_009844 [Peronosclerospora sorghi]|uniref:Uncharacterized protein n=1 Tax=Peronosclerospora sorghi TaxID=230839 RepID=A0ACC0W2Q2_9STRA|nr:hypothetical protein PsorP6_009844 [Peronosclerospora sorghi]